ncbi:MAG: MFS transporter [Pseudomonadota bacterium]
MSEAANISGWAVFAHRDFRLFLLARLSWTMAFQMLGAAVGWQIYRLTGRALDLGLAGLAQFVPILLFSLPAGQVADRFDRVRVIRACLVLCFICAVLLAGLTLLATPAVGQILAVLALLATAVAFFGPAAQALMPNLVPRSHIPSAVGWHSTAWQVGTISGPALAGILLLVGEAWVYAVIGFLFALPLLLVARLAPRPAAGSKEPLDWASLTSGLRYVWRTRLVLGAISLDLVAVLLGGVTALMPIFASDILGVGAVGYGWLRAAPAIGAALTALTLAQWPVRAKLGRAMLWGVGVYGLATLIFGFSTLYPLSLIMMILAGGADMMSVFVRNNLIQLATPDALRGRVGAVSSIFVTASNELGEFESGALAALIGVVPCVIVGAAGTLLAVALWPRLFPAFAKVVRIEDEAA